MTELYLVNAGGIRRLMPALTEPAPAILSSYVYFRSFQSVLEQPNVKVRYWVLDSGAYTAHSKGKPIDVKAYIEFCKERLADPMPPKEIYSLDVIGDHRASLKNTEAMWKAGIGAIPTFHINSPPDALIHLANHYPKIALGGVAKVGKRALPWMKQCFARVWPKPIHLFGIHSEKVLFSLPFHSADSSQWLNAFAYGNWHKYGQLGGVNSGNAYIRSEVDHFLDLERKLKARWRNALKELER